MATFRRFVVCIALIAGSSGISFVAAKDFIVTIAGGYDPSGNQASLEANVIFFQTIVAEKHQGERIHEIFFADGADDTADVQEQIGDEKNLPANEFIASLHRANLETIRHRNHRVPDVSGALRPELIRASFRKIAKNAGQGDRILVYATAHGSEARGNDRFNTTINCWDDKTISMREFSSWLDQVSPDVPVIMVMAQCYCGGFSHTIFVQGDSEKGLSKQLRIGFFAQQHDLAAAGCRPDIKNDEEFSSYFLGAFIGTSRTGNFMPGCDINNDGRISFAEAYAHAVVASNTIDIPIRSSDALLRTYSWIPDHSYFPNKSRRDRRPAGRDSSDPSAPPEKSATTEKSVSNAVAPNTDDLKATAEESATSDSTPLDSMSGTLESFAADQNAETRRVIEELSRLLGFSMSDDVSVALDAYREHLRAGPAPTGRGPGRRSSSGRRELLELVSRQWPEFAERDKWRDAEALKVSDQAALMEEFRQLEGFDIYQQRRLEREESAAQAEQREVQGVRHRRLIDTLEVVVLARNLSRVASPEIVARYKEMLQLEQSSL